MITRTAIIALCLLALARTTHAADEPPSKDAARDLLEEGNRLYQGAKYAAALARYEAAYKLYPSPKLLYSIACAHEQLRDLAKAADEFASFLRLSGMERGSRIFNEAEAGLARTEKSLGRVRIRGLPEGTSVFIDERLAGRFPLEGDIHVVPGEHEVQARGDEHEDYRAKIAVKEGELTEVNAKMELSAKRTSTSSAASIALTQLPPARSDEDGSPISSPWLWLGVGVAAAAVIGGGIFIAAQPHRTDLGTSALSTWDRVR